MVLEGERAMNRRSLSIISFVVYVLASAIVGWTTGKWSEVIYFLTGLILMWYTLETREVRLATLRQVATAARQAETAERQAITAQQMLDAAHRPWLAIAVYADVGTMRDVLNMVSVFTNHGNVPATVTSATMRGSWEGKTWVEGEQLAPKDNPSNLCIFPSEQDELRWGIMSPSFAPWPMAGFLRLHFEIAYRGAFEERTYQTRIEVSTPVPEGKLGGRRDTPMQIVRMETT